MIHKITLVREDGSEVVLDTKPKHLSLDTEEYGLVLDICWDPRDLARDAAEYRAIKAAWPGKETVLLADNAGAQLFSGKISGIFSGKEGVGFKASEDAVLPGEVALTVTEDTADPNRLSVLVVVDNHGEGGLTVDFGDGTPEGTSSGDGSTSSSHAYAAAGTYMVTVTDVDQADRSGTFEVTVPFGGGVEPLALTVLADLLAPNRQRASILVDNKGAGEVSLSFGDGSADGSNPGDGLTNTEHDYSVGTFSVTATDVSDPTRTASQEVVIPFPEDDEGGEEN